MKQMSLIEMDGFLKGKCIPRDLKVNETNAEYLVRKFAEAEAKCAALAAENARCLFEVSRCHQTVDEMFHHKDKWFDKEWLSALWSTSKQLMENTPATDAFLAEIERKAIRKFINSIEHILRDKLSPYDTEEMLEAMRIFLEEQGGEQK
ncbi:hypothetical protein AAGV89_000382 [Escherichia coli]|nr:hypothetical protein [Escherichia coli]MBB8598549.1 hypothetical protein [Escherichia coli]MBC0419033.1 hypothetical protein [Escherichia coli]HDX6525123.1 hypothetical protein [Escherichia coli]